MTESKHTAGKWQAKHFPEMVSYRGMIKPTGAMRRSIFSMRFDAQGRRVTQVLADVHEQAADAGQGEANSHLIAAAPDLLDALIRASEHIPHIAMSNSGDGRYKCDPPNCPACVTKAAIAKATGCEEAQAA